MTEMKKGARMTGEAREQATSAMVEQYAAGKSIREIAEASGRSYGFVHRILSEAGTSLRGRGGATRRKSEAVAS